MGVGSRRSGKSLPALAVSEYKPTSRYQSCVRERIGDSASSRERGPLLVPGRWDFEISLYSAEQLTFNLRTQIENGSEVIDLRRSQTSHNRFY